LTEEEFGKQKFGSLLAISVTKHQRIYSRSRENNEKTLKIFQPFVDVNSGFQLPFMSTPKNVALKLSRFMLGNIFDNFCALEILSCFHIYFL
jgi:hypothetical protein